MSEKGSPVRGVDYDESATKDLFHPFFVCIKDIVSDCTRSEVMELFDGALENAVVYACNESVKEPKPCNVRQHLQIILFETDNASWWNSVKKIRRETGRAA